MSTQREQSVEFVCAGLCDEDERPTYMVDGCFNAEGEFEPATIDEMGSDIRVADL